MRRDTTQTGASAVLLGISLAVAVCVRPGAALAQYGYPCPLGYYYYPNYGCVPPGYFYGSPYYAYPDFGFELFYGPGWGRRWGSYYGQGRGLPHGGGIPRGGAPPGGGGHGGGHRGR
jgi:hypothetical protein